jgi:Ca2+-binding RTX toxin-like protein
VRVRAPGVGRLGRRLRARLTQGTDTNDPTGRSGSDDLDGGTGDDRLRAGGSIDTLRSGTGIDRLDGGGDADTCIDADRLDPFPRCELT